MIQENITKIVLIRHGESEANRKIQSDIGCWFELEDHLTSRGKEQINNLYSELEKMQISSIFCSDTNRAKESAELIAKKLGLAAVIDENIDEHKISKKILTEKQLLQLYDSWKKGEDLMIEDSENIKKFSERISNELNKYVKIKKNILLVTHNGFIQVALALLQGQNVVQARAKEIDFGTGYVLEFNDELFWRVSKIPVDANFIKTLPYRMTRVAIIVKDKEVLVVHKKCHAETIWTFPQGGALNIDESAEETLRRELMEELNITKFKVEKSIPVFQQFEWPKNFEGHKGFIGLKMEFFLIKDISTFKPDNDELDRAQFVPISKIEKYIDFNFQYGYGKELLARLREWE